MSQNSGSESKSSLSSSQERTRTKPRTFDRSRSCAKHIQAAWTPYSQQNWASRWHPTELWAGRFPTTKIHHGTTSQPDQTYRRWFSEQPHHRCSICEFICGLWHCQSPQVTDKTSWHHKITSNSPDSSTRWCRTDASLSNLIGRRADGGNRKNGLPQGGVLAPTLYNIYTADFPSTENTRNYIYADDICITAQHSTFEAVELNLNTALASLSEYYRANYLRANPSENQVCLFNLKNREAKRGPKLKWNNVQLNHCEHPVYLGVKLDRSLSFKKHIEKTIGKVESRNAIIGKLATSYYGADPKTVQTAVVALWMSSAEYACPVWSRSAHVKKLDTTLNNT